MPGLSGARTTSLPESVLRALELLRDRVGLVVDVDEPGSVPPVVDIFASGSCRSMIRAPTSGYGASGSTSTSP